MNEKVYKNFGDWVDQVLINLNTDRIKAFCFNLYEDEISFHIQLIGASTFDENDTDWPTDEVYSSGENIFIVSKTEAGEKWQQGLSFCSDLIKTYINKGKYNDKLASKEAVAVGFVDGDLEILYQK